MQNNILRQNRKGQVLLIAVTLLATAITVVMTIAFNSTTESQIARLEVDSQKALAAAEAGIDAVIKQSATSFVNIGDLGQFSSQGISGNAQVSSVSKTSFVTPLLQKDEQYTLYLSDYPGFANPWNGKLDIYLVSEGGCPSIEVTIVKSDYTLDRYAYNTCSSPSIISNTTDTTVVQDPSVVVDSVSFGYKISSSIVVPALPAVPPVGGIVAFVKVLGGRTKIGFQGYESDGSTPKSLPIQGKTVESEARTTSGVVKKVQLFQSFPQIPSNFFMTSF